MVSYLTIRSLVVSRDVTRCVLDFMGKSVDAGQAVVDSFVAFARGS